MSDDLGEMFDAAREGKVYPQGLFPGNSTDLRGCKNCPHASFIHTVNGRCMSTGCKCPGFDPKEVRVEDDATPSEMQDADTRAQIDPTMLSPNPEEKEDADLLSQPQEVNYDKLYIEREFERTAREHTPLVAENLEELYLLCELRGRPVPSDRRKDYHYLRYKRLDWLKEWPRSRNLDLLKAAVKQRSTERKQESPVAPMAFLDDPASFEGIPATWAAIKDVARVLNRRGRLYAHNSEFEVFKTQAQINGLDMRQQFMGPISQKMTRERTLWAQINEGDVSDETWEAYLDSIRDFLGYGMLYFGWALREANKYGLGGERDGN